MKKTFIKFRHAPKIVSRRFAGAGRMGYAAYKSDGKDGKDGEADDTDPDKKELKTSADLLKELGEIKSGLEKKAKEDAKAEAKAIIDEKLIEVNKKIDEVKGLPKEVTPEQLVKALEDLQITMKAFDRFQINFKNNGKQAKVEVKTFNEILAETIKENADKIQGFKKGSPELRMDMKAVGDMSIPVNFPTAGIFNQDIRSNLIPNPYNRVWLGDVLPGGTSKGSSILYPKENGGDGGAAFWDPTSDTDKAQMDFKLTGQTAYFKWIAGYVIIEREMLDDIDFLNSYLQMKMLISLKIAENDFILNGTSDTNPVQGFNDVATAYNGTFTKSVDRIIDAAWGQLVEDTFDFYNPTDLILTPRNSVQIGLNTATGSGEYDLPSGSVAFAAGKLALADLELIRTTDVGTGNFIAFDKSATAFVKKLQPELRMFEDATLAKRNKLMFRVEERATLAIFNNSAIIKGTLAASS